MYKKFIKRCIDIFGSLLGILLLWWVMAIVAIAIKIDSKGPAIFKGRRMGKEMKPFYCLKFRSMYVEAPKECATVDLDGDKYITKVGRVIRKLSIDEFPQLFNILKGEMSFVGPRPCTFVEDELIELRKQNGSFDVKPGLTGLAQVNGRDITAANVPLKAKYDGEYANNITFLNDAKIFFKTFKVALFGDDIVEGKEAKDLANKIEQESKEKEQEIKVEETVSIEETKENNMDNK